MVDGYVRGIYEAGDRDTNLTARARDDPASTSFEVGTQDDLRVIVRTAARFDCLTRSQFGNDACPISMIRVITLARDALTEEGKGMLGNEGFHML